MKKVLSFFKLIVKFSASIFPFALVFYLVLFLLENLFSGIVSNNIDLNYLLIAVFLFGFLAVFANGESSSAETVEEQNPTKWDFVIAGILSVLSFIILFYKTQDQGWERWVISLVGAILVGFVSVVLIYPETEEVVEIDEITEVDQVKTKTFHFDVKRLFLSRIKVPVPVVLIVLLFLVMFNPKNITKIRQSIGGSVDQQTKNELVTTTPTITPTPTSLIAIVLPAADPNLKIIVANAGAEKGEAKRIGNLFKEAGYKDVIATDSAKNIDNALIEFQDTESGQADLVQDILRGEYLIVNRAPSSTTSAEIKVFLGAQPMSTDGGFNYQNENFDFFFN